MKSKKVTIELPLDFYQWLRDEAYHRELRCNENHQLTIKEYIVKRLVRCSMSDYHHNNPTYKEPVALELGCWCNTCKEWELL